MFHNANISWNLDTTCNITLSQSMTIYVNVVVFVVGTRALRDCGKLVGKLGEHVSGVPVDASARR